MSVCFGHQLVFSQQQAPVPKQEVDYHYDPDLVINFVLVYSPYSQQIIIRGMDVLCNGCLEPNKVLFNRKGLFVYILQHHEM